MTQIAGAGANEAQSQNSFVPVELIASDELTVEEQRDRLHLERIIERSFYEAGIALKELRDRRLYRSTHKTFTEYCSERFGYGKNNANMKILAASVVDEIQKMTTNGYMHHNVHNVFRIRL